MPLGGLNREVFSPPFAGCPEREWLINPRFAIVASPFGYISQRPVAGHAVGWHRFGDLVHDGVRVQVPVLAEATPQRWPNVRERGAIPIDLSIAAIGLIAKAEPARIAIL